MPGQLDHQPAVPDGQPIPCADRIHLEPLQRQALAALAAGDPASVTTSRRRELQRGLCEGRTGVERPGSRPDPGAGTWPDIFRYQVPHLQEDTVAWGDLRADSSAVQYVLPVTGK